MSVPNAIFYGLNQFKIILGSPAIRERYQRDYTHVRVTFHREFNPKTGPLTIITTDTDVKASIETADHGQIVFYDNENDLSVQSIVFMNL